MLQNVRDILDRLTKRQQVILALSTVFAAVGILLMGLVATKTQMALLYSGLDEITVAELAEKLDGMKVDYEHRNGAMYIDKTKRDKVRMELAREGIPRKGQKGYELLDDVSGFGTTSEMFEATYWRAKEGEIARTIAAIDEIEDARVHISPQQKVAFIREGNEASASVMVKMRGGITPDKDNARAIKYLVALAVRGLNPNKVSVIDASSGKIVGGEEDDPNFVYIQKRIELEHKMGVNLEQLIGSHVGFDNVKVQVAVDINNQEEIVRQKNIDPESKTIISTSSSEKSDNSTEGKSGEVSVANNIPANNTSADGGGGTSSNSKQTEEKVNYEVSQSESEKRTMAGDIKRMSVAVMVGWVQEKDKDDKLTWRERSAEELKSIEDLVKSASGFDEKRGDSVTVRSLTFNAPPEMSSPPSVIVGIFEQNFDLIIQVLALLLSIAGIAFGVVRPILQMGGDSKHKEEVAKMRAMYEEQIQALLPEEEVEDPVHPMQVLLSEIEDAIAADPEEALTIIRQWLHESAGMPADKKEIDGSGKKRVVMSGMGE